MADIELLSPPQGVKRALWRDFLARAGLAEEAVEQVLRLVDQGARLKDAAREVAEHTGLSKNELYAAALDRR